MPVSPTRAEKQNDILPSQGLSKTVKYISRCKKYSTPDHRAKESSKPHPLSLDNFSSLTGQSQRHGKHLAFGQGYSRLCWKSGISKISADMDLKFPVTISDSLSMRRMFRRMRRISNEIDSSEIWRQSTTALSPDVHVESTAVCILTGILEALLEVWSQNRSPILSLDIRSSMKNFLYSDR